MQRVLRLTVGDCVDIFDGRGGEYRSEIIGQDRHGVVLRILETIPSRPESPLIVTMGQSLIKGDKMDAVVQKATEMGVSRVIPFVSSRSVVRLHDVRAAERVKRWRRIAVESAKQCGRAIPLDVEGVLRFDEVLHRAPPRAIRIVLWEHATNRLKPFLREAERLPERPRAVYFLVGPEGGFTEEEIRQAQKVHFVPLGLGLRILRVETAGLGLVSILQYEWGDWG
jgi:16S rRNA (uracil1498-N3)-methyltransferase